MGTLVGIAVCVGNKRAVTTAPSEVEPTGIMTFADPAVQALCAKTWGDGTNITYEQAREVTEIPTNWAKSNTTITSFNEIKYFKNLTAIGSSAFSGCTSLALTSLELPQCTSIGAFAFQGCSSMALTSLELPKCTSIGEAAFQNCTSLAFDELNLPNLTTLGLNAFNGVSIRILNLGNISILPNALTNGANFGSKSVLEELTFASREISNIPSYSFYGYSKLMAVNIVSESLSLDICAFFNCSLLETWDFLGAVTKIDSGTFNGANLTGIISLPNLSSVVSSNVNYGGSFSNKNLEGIASLGSITSIPSYKRNSLAFIRSCTKLRFVIFPETLTSLGNYTIYNCTALSYVVFKAITPPSITTTSLLGTTYTIYVPDESVEAYKTATNWTAYANRILPLSQYNG